MSRFATRAGLTRQTLYAHFPSRDALIEALIDRSTDRVIDALWAADLDSLPAGEALAELVRCGWQEIEATRFLLTVPLPAGAERDRERHAPVLRYLDEIVERGLRDGEFDPALPAAWLAAATMALGHAAGDQVRDGAMTADQARTTLGHPDQGIQRLNGDVTPAAVGGSDAGERAVGWSRTGDRGA